MSKTSTHKVGKFSQSWLSTIYQLNARLPCRRLWPSSVQIQSRWGGGGPLTRDCLLSTSITARYPDGQDSASVLSRGIHPSEAKLLPLFPKKKFFNIFLLLLFYYNGVHPLPKSSFKTFLMTPQIPSSLFTIHLHCYLQSQATTH